jgi:hypothetical protein
VVVAAGAVGETTARVPCAAVLAVVEVVSPSTVSIEGLAGASAAIAAWERGAARPMLPGGCSARVMERIRHVSLGRG